MCPLNTELGFPQWHRGRAAAAPSLAQVWALEPWCQASPVPSYPRLGTYLPPGGWPASEAPLLVGRTGGTATQNRPVESELDTEAARTERPQNRLEPRASGRALSSPSCTESTTAAHCPAAL